METFVRFKASIGASMLGLLALAVVACDGPVEPSYDAYGPAPDPVVHGNVRIGKVDAPAPPGNQKYWIDMVDGGDDPWVAGCHYEHTDPTCSSWTMNKYGDDRWPGGIPMGNPPVWQELREWTNKECHPELPLDQKPYNCDVICQNPAMTPDGIKHDHGCVGKVQAVCQPGVNVDSAKCMCWDDPNPPPMECLAWGGGPGGPGGTDESGGGSIGGAGDGTGDAGGGSTSYGGGSWTSTTDDAGESFTTGPELGLDLGSDLGSGEAIERTR